jgi:hypothetical protein
MKQAFLILFLSLFGIAVSAQSGPTGIITGRVESRDDKKPIQGATVKATRSTTKEVFQVETNDKGEFKIADLQPGTYVIEVDADKRNSTRLNVLQTVAAGKTTTLSKPIQMDAERSFSIISGAVFNARGLSMANVKLTIERISSTDPKLKKGKLDETVSNQAGEFAFRFPGADAVYRVTATAKGYKTVTKDVDVQKDEKRNIALQMTPEK